MWSPEIWWIVYIVVSFILRTTPKGVLYPVFGGESRGLDRLSNFPQAVMIVIVDPDFKPRLCTLPCPHA